MKGQIYHRGECDYGNLDAVNFSTLKAIDKSPLHYRHYLQHPRKQTEPMALGAAAHIAVFEPERFLKEYALWDEKTDTGRTRPRVGKDWNAFKAANAGKQIIRIDEYNEAIAYKDAVRADETAMKYLAVGRPEVTVVWVDEHTQMKCKGRLDWLGKHQGHPCIVEVKTAADASRFGFSRQVAKMGYHRQCAFYGDGIEAATGSAPTIVVVVVEKTPPYDVVTYIVPPDVTEIGRDEYRAMLEKLSECRATDTWHGQGEGREQILQLPRWAVPDDDDTADLGLTGWKETA